MTELDVSNFNIEKVISSGNMFGNCSNLVVLDLSNFDISNVEEMDYMFWMCSKLKTIYANSDWNTGKSKQSYEMFGGCTNLVGAISYNSSNRDVTYANPDTGYFTRKTL